MEQDRIICQKCGQHNALGRSRCIHCGEEMDAGRKEDTLAYPTLPTYKRASREPSKQGEDQPTVPIAPREARRPARQGAAQPASEPIASREARRPARQEAAQPAAAPTAPWEARRPARQEAAQPAAAPIAPWDARKPARQEAAQPAAPASPPRRSTGKAEKAIFPLQEEAAAPMAKGPRSPQSAESASRAQQAQRAPFILENGMIPLETQSQRFSGQPAGGAALQNAPFAAAAPAEQSAGAAAWGEAAQHLDPSFQDSLKEPLLDASLADIGSAQKSMQLSGFALVSLNGDYSYHIPIDSKETVIGRAAEAKEFLRNKPFVSRRHCKVRIIGQKAYLEDINETNHTYVNNAAVKEGYMAELSDGDEIGLGGKIIGGARQEEAAFFVFHYA